MQSELKVLDSGYVSIVESWGSDQRIIEAARMSTSKGFLGWGTPDSPGDEKLLAFLYNNKHSTPFEMAGMTIEVKAPIFVFREWHRHRTQCLTGDTLIACVTPTDTTYKRTIKQIHDLRKGVEDTEPRRTRNGYSKVGTPVTREARRKDPWRVRVIPNCQSRLLRVVDEKTGDFTTGRMADVWESGVKPVFMLRTESGRFIRTSSEHPFFTADGWVKLKDLRPGDRIARMGKIAASDRVIPPALRQGIGVWTSMMRGRLIRPMDDCHICSKQFPFSELALDHVVPVVDDLRLALDERNLKPACLRCHRKKTDSEQPDRHGQTKRGIRWEKITEMPVLVGEEMTYDIEVEGPHHNYVANDFVVHNSYNEMSARYIPLPDENYLPSVERIMNGANTATTNKQAQGSGKHVTEEIANDWLKTVSDFYGKAEELYQAGLQAGIPKELARIVVPVARYSRMRASANLRNWLAFLTLRQAKAAQWEIREYADAVAAFVADRFPRTYELFQAEMDRSSK